LGRLIEKARPIRARLRSKGLSLEIRSRANMRPLLSLIYALAHANKNIAKSRNSNESLYAHKLVMQVRDLSSMATSLKNSNDVHPNEHSKGLEAATSAYVEMFYALNKEERKKYIDSIIHQFGSRKSKIKHDRNLLIIPALMAELKQPKEDVVQGLYRNLYVMPFKLLIDSSKSALHVALFEQGIAIRTVQYETVERFSKSMQRLEERMKAVQSGELDPDEDPENDEDIKANFIERAAQFSKSSDINVMDIISEKVRTDSAIRAALQRIIRKNGNGTNLLEATHN